MQFFLFQNRFSNRFRATNRRDSGRLKNIARQLVRSTWEAPPPR